MHYFESVVFAGAFVGVVGLPAGLLQPATAPAKHAINTAHSTLVFKVMTLPLRMRHPTRGGNTNSKTALGRSQVPLGYDDLSACGATILGNLSNSSPISPQRDAQLPRPQQPMQPLDPVPRSNRPWRARPCL